MGKKASKEPDDLEFKDSRSATASRSTCTAAELSRQRSRPWLRRRTASGCRFLLETRPRWFNLWQVVEKL
jgi:hypothetical protein